MRAAFLILLLLLTPSGALAGKPRMHFAEYTWHVPGVKLMLFLVPVAISRILKSELHVPGTPLCVEIKKERVDEEPKVGYPGDS